jgi:sensor histidine kinase regulating citrate/malate metabolism
MDELSDEIKIANDKNILYLRVAQIVGISLTMLMFIYTVFVTGRNLRKNDDELERARQETQGILNTVKEGLFLLDNDLVISSQHSKEMLDIFEVDSISGREFSQLIGEILGSSDLSTVEEFVKLLFDDHVIEDLIGSLNPLDKVEVTFNKSDGSIQKKYLNFDFFRVVRDKEIQEILVSVRDITSRVLLEQELESTKEQGEQQVEMLVSFLQADPKMLRAFLLDSRESLGEVNAILKDPVMDKADLKGKIDKMFISIHRMKGEAGAMKFEAFAEKAHEFESDLSELKRVTNIKGLDFLPLTIRLDKLISYTDTLNELSNRLEGASAGGELSIGDTTIMAAPITEEQRGAWAHLDQLVEKVATDTGKQVRLVKSGLVESDLDDNQNKMVKDVLIQLLRNSIVHGIETPEERTKVRKNAFGRIDLRLATLSDGSVELTVRDDGKGLDIASIKKRILSKGLATEADLNNWSEQKIISMAFASGFSTSEETNMHAGRGVGLDIIRDSVKKIGGQLRLRQSAGKYCQFEIVLPATAV